MLAVLDRHDGFGERLGVVREIIAVGIEGGDRVEAGAFEERIASDKPRIVALEDGKRVDDDHRMAGERSPIRAGQGGERALDVDDQGRPVLQPDQVRDQQAAGLARAIRADRDQMPVAGIAVLPAGGAPVALQRLVGILGRGDLIAEIDAAIGRPEVLGHQLDRLPIVGRRAVRGLGPDLRLALQVLADQMEEAAAEPDQRGDGIACHDNQAEQLHDAEGTR